MPRTLLFNYGFWRDNWAIWPWPDKLPSGDFELPDREDLVSKLHFAERRDGTAKGVGSGPFFAATYIPPGGDPTAQTRSYGEVGISPTTGITVTHDASDGKDFYREAQLYYIGGRYAHVSAHVQFQNGRMVNQPAVWIIYKQAGSTWSRGTRFGYPGTYRVPYDYQTSPERTLMWLLAHAYQNYRAYNYSRDFRMNDAQYQEGSSERVTFDKIPFKFGEFAYYNGQAYPGLTSPFARYGTLHPGLFSAAFYEAQDSLPTLLSNTFQNLLEVGQTILSFADGIDLSDLKSAKKVISNGWLGYRYQYNTTIGDMQELESMIERFDDLSRQAGNITSYGIASDATGNYHCALVINPVQILNQSWLKKLNLRPTLANVWDMIPYSFIVDWFTNIGDVLSGIDKWLDTPSLGHVECWYSYTNTYTTDEGGRLTVFFRYQGGTPLLPYWSMDYSHNNRVWAYRATDIVALLV